jgi:hypothetical protein
VRRPLAALAAAALLLPVACTRDLGPEATYRALTRAVADRDEGAAWALLSRSTQRWLENRAREAARAAPGVVAPGARQLLLGDAALTVAPPSVIELVRNDGKGAPAEVELVREGGAWKVDIGPPRSPGPAAPTGPSGWTGPGPSAK